MVMAEGPGIGQAGKRLPKQPNVLLSDLMERAELSNAQLAQKVTARHGLRGTGTSILMKAGCGAGDAANTRGRPCRS